MTNKGMKYINNGIIQKMIKSDEEMPEGFQYGKLPITDETRKILSESHKGKKLSKESIEKRQKTFKEKYGVNSCSQLEGVGEKISQKLSSKEVQEKMKNTCYERYGVNNVLQNEYFKNKMRNTNLIRHGDKNYNNKKKEYLTREKNKTLGLFETNEEKLLYDYLIDKYSINNVIKQYYSDEYPFKADFYIKSLNCYIEYNGYWTHGSHPFNAKNQEDIDKLKEWEEKAKTIKFYQNAIYTWTDLDVRKRSYIDKINLIILYPEKHNDIVYSFKKLEAELDSYKK